jgi:hypothetical protein
MLTSDKLAELEISNKSHVAGAFSLPVLRRLESLFPTKVDRTAETGCGKSTIIFSNASSHHSVFCIDDREHGQESSINFFMDCPLTQKERVHLILGPTQITLPKHVHSAPYDVVLIDGPHGYPFPEIEYYYFYPHIREGGMLIIDDVHIATIGRLADFIAEDEMFDFVELVSTTAVFRRNSALTFDPLGDGWWKQDFNRRRIPEGNAYLEPYALRDGKHRQPFGTMFNATSGTSSDSASKVHKVKKKKWRLNSATRYFRGK